MALGYKQRAFVEAYLSNGFNGVKAARTAGYKGNDATLAQVAYENLRKPEIKALIDERIKAMAMSADEAMARLSEQGRGDMGDFAHVLTADDLQQHPQSRLVKKFKRTVIRDGELPAGRVEEHVEVELYEAQSALTIVLKEQHLKAGEPTDRFDVDDGKARDARSELERALADLAERSRPPSPPGNADPGAGSSASA